MSLTTTTVRFQLYDRGGVPLSDARVEVELTTLDTDAATGAIIPRQPQAAISDETGLVELEIWPNARGTRASQYKVAITPAGHSRPSTRTRITVPESGTPVDFRSIISEAPYPPKSDAQLAQEAAQQYAAEASASAAAADLDAQAAAASAAAAAASETDAEAAATAAQTAQAAAETARDAAQAAESAANTHSTDAQAARDAAQTAQAAAETARDAAQTARTAAEAAQAAAEIARDEAVTARNEAETFAAESAGNAVALVGVLQHALDQAGQAARELEALGLRVDDATESTAPVLGILQHALDQAGQASRALSGGRAAFTGGSAADPAITVGDVGIYSSAAGTLSVAIGGTEVVRIDADGITVFGTVTESP